MITGDRRSGANALRPFLSPHPGFPYYFFATGGLSPAIALTPTLWALPCAWWWANTSKHGTQSRKSRRRGTEVPRSEQNLHFALQARRSICWEWSNQGVCSLLLDGFFQELYTGFIVVAFCNVQRGFVLTYFLLFCSEFK